MILARVLGFTLLGAVLADCALPLMLPFRSALAIEFLADPPRRVARGFHGIEQTPDGLTYAWTGETFAISIPNLDRGTRWRLTMRAAASRADGTQPVLVASVDGAAATRTTLPANGFVDIDVEIAPAPQAPRTTTVAFQVTPTFVPGPGDQRSLGVQVDAVRLTPAGRVISYGASRGAALVLGAAAGLLAGALGVPLLAGLAILGLFAIVMGLTLTQGFATYLAVSWRLPLTGAVIAALVSFLMLGRRRPGASIVAAITFAAVAIQLLLLSHPDMPLGDAIFQAHRYQDVLGGKYYFTSIAPGNYQFPYPIGLYVASLPFSGLAQGELQNAALLRVVVVVLSAIAAALLYCPMLRWSNDLVTAVAAVVAYHVLPLGFDVTATGNLTNMFGQGLAMLAFAMAAGNVTKGRPWQIAIFLVVVTAAMLSHTSTFAVLTTQILVAGLAVLIVRGAADRRAGLLLIGAGMLAATTAVIVYYGHFGDVYREAWARITAESGRANEATGGRTPLVRLLDVPRLLELAYGWPMVGLAIAGVAAMLRARPATEEAPEPAPYTSAPLAAPDPITAESIEPETPSLAPVVVTGWLLASLLFLVIGVVTPVDLRHLLAALPAMAVLSAAGVGEGWRAGRWVRAGVVVLVAWAIVRAVGGLLTRLP